MTHIFRQFAPLAVLLLTCCVCEAQQSPSTPTKKPVVKKSGESLKSNKTDQHKTTESKPSGAIDTLTSAPASESEQKQHQDQPQREPYTVKIVSQPRDELFVTYVRITAASLIVGVGTLIVVLRQTKSTRIAANAAKASADVLINIERPWLLVSRAHSQRPPSSVGGKSYLLFNVKNYGKTPAMILEVGGSARFVDELRELSEKPEYGTAGFYNYRPLAFDMESGDI
jgi:hypothetical protein